MTGSDIHQRIATSGCSTCSGRTLPRLIHGRQLSISQHRTRSWSAGRSMVPAASRIGSWTSVHLFGKSRDNQDPKTMKYAGACVASLRSVFAFCCIVSVAGNIISPRSIDRNRSTLGWSATRDYPQTLVLYRTRPARRPEPTCTLIMGRIRYSTSVSQYRCSRRARMPLLNFSLPNGPDVCCWED